MNTQTLVDLLQTAYPTMKIYNGSINKADTQCIGVYARGRVAPVVAIGGVNNSSYNTKSYTILVHWTENSTQCETQAQNIYDYLFGMVNITQGDVNIRMVEMVDSSPVDISRDDRNICEMAIRLNITYERSTNT